jgi:hypothetical protein
MSFINLKDVSEAENSAVKEAWKSVGADLVEKTNDRFSIGLSLPFVTQHEKFIADQIRHVFDLCDRS